VETLACDVRFQDQVQRAVREVVERFGRVDVLVNNAGVIQVRPEETMRVSDYQEAMDTHFFGPLFLVQTVLPEMRRRGEGRIVNISSVGEKYRRRICSRTWRASLRWWAGARGCTRSSGRTASWSPPSARG
jgi:NAD(P)-dependent dehydrogenase (short-subunit alcohol dehydrogenase family)